MTKDFSELLDFKKNKIGVLGVILVVVLSLGLYSFLSSPVKNTAHEYLPLTIPEMGGLKALDVAMKENGKLRSKVEELIDYDEAYIFVNYRDVDTLVIDIMFLWMGFSPKEIEQRKRQELATDFIRRFYSLPKDEPIKNNPFLKDRPWLDIFQEVKAKLLMQGQGHRIYDGVAYYDSQNNKMVVEGELSSEYLQGFAEFVKSQPQDNQKGYINNYLLFVEETLGLKHLSKKEKDMLKDVEFL